MEGLLALVFFHKVLDLFIAVLRLIAKYPAVGIVLLFAFYCC